MINWVLSILSHVEARGKGLSEEEATFLSKELALKTHPQDFVDAHKIIADLLKEFKKK